MTLELTATHDNLIWSPDVVFLIWMKTPPEDIPHVFGGTVQNEHFETLKSIFAERQPKPIDWLITRRDEIIVEFAKTWMTLGGDRSPLKFAENIWNPVRKKWLESSMDKETDAEYYKRVGPIEINNETKRLYSLSSGLLCCLYSMETLDAGDIESTVEILINASWFSGNFAGTSLEKHINPTPYSAFARLGASKKNEGNQATKADAMAHYVEKGHEPGYETKEDAGFKLAEEFGVSPRTAGRWIVRLKPKHPKPAKVPR